MGMSKVTNGNGIVIPVAKKKLQSAKEPPVKKRQEGLLLKSVTGSKALQKADKLQRHNLGLDKLEVLYDKQKNNRPYILVKKGDSFWSLAKKINKSTLNVKGLSINNIWSKLQTSNKDIAAKKFLNIGDKIYINDVIESTPIAKKVIQLDDQKPELYESHDHGSNSPESLNLHGSMDLPPDVLGSGGFDDSFFDDESFNVPEYRSLKIKTEGNFLFNPESANYTLFNKTDIEYIPKTKGSFSWQAGVNYTGLVFGQKDSLGSHKLSLGKMTLEYDFLDYFTITAGNNTCAWGESIFGSKHDVANPMDNRLPVLDFEAKKMPIPMVNIEIYPPEIELGNYGISNLHGEAVVIPFFTPNENYTKGAPFSAFYDIKKQIPEVLHPNIDNLKTDEDKPKGSEFALNVSGTLNLPIKNIDFSLTGFSGYSRNPSYSGLVESGFTRINKEYKRSDSIGLGFGFAAESINSTLYFEGTYKTNEPFLTEELSSTSKDTLTTAAGVRYIGNGYNLELELSSTTINSYDPDILFFDKHNVSWNSRLNFEITDNIDFDFTSSIGIGSNNNYFNPKITYKGIENLSIGLQGYVFSGDKDNQFGLLGSDHSSASTFFTYHF